MRMHFANLALTIIATITSFPAKAQVGHFNGLPVVQLDPDGRHAKLMNRFSYTDSSGTLWAVPIGKVVDGASIPQVFWTFIGGPWNGPYRNASIIHDYYCVMRTRPWPAVHRVFYEAMLAGGVDPIKAKIMYYSVYKFGPRWNSAITKVPGVSFDGQPTMVSKTVIVDIPPPPYNAGVVERDQKLIKERNLSLIEIEALARR